MSWHWPQYLFAGTWIITFLHAVYKDLNNYDTPRINTVAWLVIIPIYGYALHVGGFW